MAADWRMTVRAGPKVERDRFATLDEALLAARARVDPGLERAVHDLARPGLVVAEEGVQVRAADVGEAVGRGGAHAGAATFAKAVGIVNAQRSARVPALT